ncbi:MAG: GPW/gp25 family protein [Sulfurifustaceae bacterium]
MPRLADTTYLAFPFRVDSTGPRTEGREAHVRGQIEQTLFTAPGERVFRHDFGAGVKRLVFEPYSEALRQMVQKRLSASLTDVLRGEVDPKTLEIGVGPNSNAAAETLGADGRLEITVSYKLATINQDETHTFGGGSSG